MRFVLQPWQFFFVILVGWVHREQQEIIQFYQAQLDAVMKAQGKKRLALTDDQRRVLAVSFSAAFRTVLEGSGVEPVRLPAKSPNLNAHLERFHLSIKSECLSRTLFFGENSLRRAVGDYLDHYDLERNHQSLGNRLIEPGENVGQIVGDIQCRERLGGMLRYYYRDAA